MAVRYSLSRWSIAAPTSGRISVKAAFTWHARAMRSSSTAAATMLVAAVTAASRAAATVAPRARMTGGRHGCAAPTLYPVP
jgi:hypothetical protein